VDQLEKLGYKRVAIADEKAILANLQTQLGKHNKVNISDNEFKQILNFINKGNIFERARVLRDRVPYLDDQSEFKTIELINQIHWCQNEFQVTQQISMEGQYKNRYDVTILINGLPMNWLFIYKRTIRN